MENKPERGAKHRRRKKGSCRNCLACEFENYPRSMQGNGCRDFFFNEGQPNENFLSLVPVGTCPPSEHTCTRVREKARGNRMTIRYVDNRSKDSIHCRQSSREVCSRALRELPKADVDDIFVTFRDTPCKTNMRTYWGCKYIQTRVGSKKGGIYC